MKKCIKKHRFRLVHTSKLDTDQLKPYLLFYLVTKYIGESNEDYAYKVKYTREIYISKVFKR